MDNIQIQIYSTFLILLVIVTLIFIAFKGLPTKWNKEDKKDAAKFTFFICGIMFLELIRKI